MNASPILLLTAGDPWGTPRGGQSTFARHLLTAFGNKLAMSSYCNDLTVPVGKWVYRFYEETPILFFNRGAVKVSNNKKPLIPARVTAYFRAVRYLQLIREKEFSGILLDSPEILFAASHYKWKSVCYRFAGLNNPVANSRYQWARALGTIFEKYHISCLKRMKPDCLIAAADRAAIEEFHARIRNQFDHSKFFQFPTRVDTTLFYPVKIEEARNQLKIPLGVKIFVATGRLCWIKGWDLLLEAMVHIKKKHSNALVIFVGDGEDRKKIKQRAKDLGIAENVKITGLVPQRDVALFMNAADVCLVGSHREGWSLAMCEMIACGKSIVSTNVSGAQDMVNNGLNGYIVDRDPEKYAEFVLKALSLPGAFEQSLNISKKYSVSTLASDLSALWSPLGH